MRRPNLDGSPDVGRLESVDRPKPPYDCLVISDLHLGSDVCQAKLLEEFLIWAVDHCRELVINGDIFDDLNFKRLTKRHFACLKVIRRNSDRDDLRLSGSAATTTARPTSSATSSASRSSTSTSTTTARSGS